MLMKNERMAEYSTRFNAATGMLKILFGDDVRVEGSLRTEGGRKRIETWLLGNFRNELRGPPKILASREPLILRQEGEGAAPCEHGECAGDAG